MACGPGNNGQFCPRHKTRIGTIARLRVSYRDSAELILLSVFHVQAAMAWWLLVICGITATDQSSTIPSRARMNCIRYVQYV